MAAPEAGVARSAAGGESRPAPARPKRGPWRLLRAAVALLALLLASELVLRLAAGLGDPVIYRPDADCGYLPVPNQHVRRFGARNDINAYGMRSPDVPASKPAGALRVLFVGDSVTFGTTRVDQSEIFTSVLAAELPARLGRPVEVLNASTGGWAVSNELGFLRSRGTFGADVVLFVLNTGDLTQGPSTPVLTLEAGYPDHKPPFAWWELWARYLRPRLLHRPPAADPGSQASSALSDGNATEAVLRELAEAKRFAERAGARFAVVFSPARGAEWEQPVYAAGLASLKDWATAEGVPLLDMTETFAAAPAAEVYQDGIHLRPRGNRIVADAIEKAWDELER